MPTRELHLVSYRSSVTFREALRCASGLLISENFNVKIARMNSGLFIAITITVGLFAVCKGAAQNEEDLQENLLHSSMAPNSKFLNPHLDDDANLQLAIAAFADAFDSPGTGDILSEPADVKFEIQPKDLRRGKYLKHWNAISLLNNLLAKRSKKF